MNVLLRESSLPLPDSLNELYLTYIISPKWSKNTNQCLGGQELLHVNHPAHPQSEIKIRVILYQEIGIFKKSLMNKNGTFRIQI